MADAAGASCERCGQPIADGQLWRYVPVWSPAGGALGRAARRRMHVECIALMTVGHDFGVCSCTGWDTSAWESALELVKRMRDRPRFALGGKIDE